MFWLRNKKNNFQLSLLSGACVTMYHGNNSKIRTFLKVQQLLATMYIYLHVTEGWGGGGGGQIPPSALTGGI